MKTFGIHIVGWRVFHNQYIKPWVLKTLQIMITMMRKVTMKVINRCWGKLLSLRGDVKIHWQSLQTFPEVCWQQSGT